MDTLSSDSLDLPQEIVDQVIDDVQDDPPTLKSCSLVSRIWLPRARTHLFREIKLLPNKEERDSDNVENFRARLQTLLAATSSSRILPALTDVTRVLTIDLSRLYSSTEVLNGLLSHFPFTNLTELSLRGSPDFPFQQTPLGCHLRKNPQLVSVKLTAMMFNNIIDFLELFTKMSSHTELRSLSLGYIYMNHRPEEMRDGLKQFNLSLPSLSRHRPRLGCLQLGAVWGMPDLLTEPLFTHSHSIFDLSSLHTLDIQSFGSLGRYSGLCDAIGRNITTLKLCFGKHNLNPSPDTWTSFKKLRRLQFLILHDQDREVITKFSQLISQALPLLPRLQHFAFGFYFYQTPNSYDFPEPFWNDLSTELDPILAELPAKNEWLKDVTVNVPPEYNPGEETLRTFFRHAYSLGLLNFCFDVLAYPLL
ncbi:hypothetical protein D9758_009053 [Tetrapyrgos nigripes]|uniref:F-box domain-containing protein n=1 Tax=Tetrapyrgos nigripes TaxID=182062 RepID=A0A8H5GA06_9AGAR|nr:hypothetical protein D9758_009053 [Tetrapyrgos nigripes]